ncbi:WYL domain-containing protein [uncultured Corynebacterium sp.]|uniref:helix-turn-helix transcriptional regulator n=1 Tax=uncultured Corynebacterium sp. TaxID=159447 RepID=UPI0025E57646|nr:WYL domain-containing protein [uncultured Corynebacterium sp.]
MAHAHDPAVERMASLTFALLGAHQSGGDPSRTAEWIQRHVPGYPQDGDGKDGAGAFRKMLSRDARTLREAGVPIAISSGKGDAPTRLRIDEDSYRLPEISFTPDEALVLGLAGGLGQTGGLSVYSQTGWTKLAAAGTTRSGAQRISAANDIGRINATDFRTLITAAERQLSVSFRYRSAPTGPEQERTMDPWGIVQRSGRVYLVGFDLDRDAPRAFRITRVHGVRLRDADKDSSHAFHPATEPLANVVAALVEPRDLVDARVRIPAGEAWELEEAGERGEDGIVTLHAVSADWLARTAAGYAPDVEVLEPQSVRDRIADLMKGL